MSSNKMKFSAFGICAFVMAACASNSANVEAAAPAEKAPSEEMAFGGAPAMWHLTDDDSEVVLFGTFHILPEGVDWQTDAFTDAMARTETTITEADVASPEAQQQLMALVQQYGLNPPGTTLSSILGPERAGQLSAVAGDLGVPFAAIEPYRPWFAIISLSTLAMQKEGFDPTKGVEPIVLAKANEEGDAIDFLETAEYQIKALSSLDGPEMLANFDVSMGQFADFKAITDRLLEVWTQGDIDALDAEFFGEMRATAPMAYDALIVDRNENWTTEIKEIMAGEGDYFIAVGAGHLAGPDSVVNMLNAEGYEVKRVQ
ncbi:MAG: TraB/GumN family protein [Pseudomonadota bacterium]